MKIFDIQLDNRIKLLNTFINKQSVDGLSSKSVESVMIPIFNYIIFNKCNDYNRRGALITDRMLSNYKTLLELSIDSYLKLVNRLEWSKLQKILKTVLNKLEGQGNQDIQKIAIKLLSALLSQLPLKDSVAEYI